MILTMAKHHENLLRDSSLSLLSAVKFLSSLETKMIPKIQNETFLKITRYYIVMRTNCFAFWETKKQGIEGKKQERQIRPTNDQFRGLSIFPAINFHLQRLACAKRIRPEHRAIGLAIELSKRKSKLSGVVALWINMVWNRRNPPLPWTREWLSDRANKQVSEHGRALKQS